MYFSDLIPVGFGVTARWTVFLYLVHIFGVVAVRRWDFANQRLSFEYLAVYMHVG
jgi:hypothetical protein